MSTLVLVRHGRTRWSTEGRFAGHADVPLDEVGTAQADRTAAVLVARSPGSVCSGDLSRAVATATRIAAAAGLTARIDPALREEELGPWTGLTRAEVADRFPAAYRRWERGDGSAYGGREGLVAVADRAVPAVLAGLADGDPLVVVTHANTALAIRGRLLGESPGQWAAPAAPVPGGWFVLATDPTGAWRTAG